MVNGTKDGLYSGLIDEEGMRSMPFTICIGKGNTPEVGAKDTAKLDEDQSVTL